MRRLAVLAVLPALLAVASCGGDDDDGGGGGSASGSFCDRAELVDARFNELESQFEGDEMPTAEVFEETADAIGDLADGAPDEIRDDLDTIAEGVARIAEVFGDIDLSDPSNISPDDLAQLEEIGSEMEEIGAEVEDASGRVETYLEDECGIVIDDDDDGGDDAGEE